MTTNDLWQVFLETGDPSVYLSYKEATNGEIKHEGEQLYGSREHDGSRGERGKGGGLR